MKENETILYYYSMISVGLTFRRTHIFRRLISSIVLRDRVLVMSIVSVLTAVADGVAEGRKSVPGAAIKSIRTMAVGSVCAADTSHRE